VRDCEEKNSGSRSVAFLSLFKGVIIFMDFAYYLRYLQLIKAISEYIFSFLLLPIVAVAVVIIINSRISLPGMR
jgi:hypothetical protein